MIEELLNNIDSLSSPDELVIATNKFPIKPEGDITSKIVIVGEAGGEVEEMQRRPFVGPSGNLLDQCMRFADIARTDCYITNVVKIHPAKNDITPFYSQRYGFTSEGKRWVSVLKKELEIIRPNVVVPLGNVALHALTGKGSITKWRGSILESSLVPGMKVIPTIHPAKALREYLYKYLIIADLKKVKSESKSPDIVRVKRDYIINPTFSYAASFLDEIKSKRELISFDIEVVNNELSCIGFATSPYFAVCIPVSRYTINEEREIMLKIASILEDENIPKLGQNIMFDITFLMRRYNIITRGRLEDTMVGHHINYPDFPKSLDFLCSIYSNEPYYKDEGKIWKNPNLSDTDFWTYNAKDAAITYDCWIKINQELVKRGTDKIYRFTMSLFPFLEYMQVRGILADESSLNTTKKEVENKRDSLQKELNSMVGYEFNPNSSKQCAEYFYIKKGVPPYINRETGNITTDDKAMARLSRKGFREAYLIQEIRRLNKFLTTYLDIRFDSDSRLRCSYNAAGTTTGRLSSSQTIFGTGANFQNIPPEFKTFLIADPGNILIEFDKRQAEWIVVAYLTGSAHMIEVVEKGLDAHIKTASLMFGAPPDIVKMEDKIIGKTTDSFIIRKLREEKIPEVLKYNPVESMSMRQAGKKSNHSFNYGLAPLGFSLQYNINIKDAKRCHALYHRTYPDIEIWHRSITEKLQRDMTLVNCFGRIRKFYNRNNSDLYKAAFAFLPQSTVADGLNYSIAKIYNDQSNEMKNVDILGQVHDSVLIQYPIDNIDNMASIILKVKEYMEPELEYNGRVFKIPTDAKIGYSWGKMEEINNPPEVIPTDKEVLKQKLRDILKKINEGEK